MKTKGAALHDFFSGFGLDAYPASGVPADVVLPYLTYDPVFDSLGKEVYISANLWYYTDSQAIPNAKAQEIAERVGMGGIIVPFAGGAAWIKRGSPWCQPLADDTAPGIKRRQLNFSVEYISAN